MFETYPSVSMCRQTTVKVGTQRFPRGFYCNETTNLMSISEFESTIQRVGFDKIKKCGDPNLLSNRQLLIDI